MSKTFEKFKTEYFKKIKLWVEGLEIDNTDWEPCYFEWDYNNEDIGMDADYSILGYTKLKAEQIEKALNYLKTDSIEDYIKFNEKISEEDSFKYTDYAKKIIGDILYSYSNLIVAFLKNIELHTVSDTSTLLLFLAIKPVCKLSSLAHAK